MLFSIARNEFRYMLKSPQTFVAFAIFFLLPFFAMISTNVQIGGGGNVNVNSPFAIVQTLMIMSVFGIFVIPAYMANTILKDVDHKMDGIIYSTPITKPAYLFGRFFGAFAALFVAMSATPLGMFVGTFWWTIDPETLGPTNLYHYAYTYVALIAPSLLALSTIIFAVAVMTRSIMYTYLATMALLIGYFVGVRLFNDPQYSEIMAVVDPFMLRNLREVTRYWTAVERNTLLLGYEGLTLYNRLLWSGISLVLIGLSYKLFSFRVAARLPKEKDSKKKNEVPVVLKAPRVVPDWSYGGYFQQFLMRTRFEVFAVLKSVPFSIIVGFNLFLVVLALLNTDIGYGVQALPVTRLMIEALDGLSLAFLVVVIFYSSDIIWRERTSGIHEIIDAAPVPNIVFVTSKLISLAVILTIITMMGIASAVVIQVTNGMAAIEGGLYFNRGFVLALYPFIRVAVLAVFLQVVCKNRFVGMMVMVVYLISSIALNQLGFEHPLYQYGGGVDTPLSDLNSNDRFVESDFWFQLYWSFFAVLLLMISYMLWNRGTLQPLSYRLRALVAFKKPVAATVTAICFAGFVSLGGYIYYNINILNEYVTVDEAERIAVLYEERFRQYENLPQPRTVDVKMNVDLFPFQQRVHTRGTHVLENKTKAPINEVHILFPANTSQPSVILEGAQLKSLDADFNYYIFELDEPMTSGEQRDLSFETLIENKGFRHGGNNSVTLVRNGTFLNNREIAPHIGFFAGLMLQDRNTRRQYDLEPLPRVAKLEDASKYDENYIRQDADFITFETTVSTVDGQTAIAPGYLTREWQENGRHYFHYAMDAPILNFYSYLSADYEVVSEEWNGVSIEVYHHAPHTYNVARMIESVKDSINYFTKAFSPYQHRQVRILEFPAYRGFAQSFPNTIPYSEGLGFIADISDDDEIDLPYYVTAHEVAHQWWGHQVMSANTQGGTVLVETLAEYSALMVMEEKYGAHKMRKFLKYELENYLRGRSNDPEGELPLYRVENQQYIHYNKGSVVMYALADYIGKDTVNRALSRLIKETAFRTPYPTTLDLIRIIREEAGSEHDTLITDLFERITLFDVKTEQANVVELPDGKFQVTLTLDAAKFEADAEGVETALEINNFIDVGLFTVNPSEAEFNDNNVIYLQKHHITPETKTIEIIVETKPVFAGLDPYNKLIDRNSNDNLTQIE
ncbi:ABC transporter permease/M1 family aminopeptidase [Kordiimonas aquimaris]|uniref:ABC transporter permease/M1 family aminopeptidase n=1 Tax=Kordiimonas aquimaris TaxID=707591 RepID=UPI0021D15909|nr:M1 family aminopeptidase [Kordiimonas aquimaris]